MMIQPFLFVVLCEIATFGFLGPSVEAQPSRCPPKVSIRPCFCSQYSKKFQIVCDGIRMEELREVLETFRILQNHLPQQIPYAFRLKNIDMKSIPNTFFKGLDICEFTAYNCSITKVEEFAFAKMSKLTLINLTHNKLTVVPNDALKHTPSLTVLILKENLIKSVDAGDFSELPLLQVLKLGHNQIRHIYSNAFGTKLTQLGELQLNNNQLQVVPSLRYLKSLKILDLSDNQITSLHLDDFSHFPQLKTLKLDGNPLATPTNFLETTNIFDNLTNLESLSLERVNLTRIDPNIFNSFASSLRHLSLAYNNLTEVPNLQLYDLEVLNLNGNAITTLNNYTLWDLRRTLYLLKLKNNRIEKIEKDAFTGLQALKHLDLFGNQIKKAPATIFIQDSINLDTLNLRDNPIECSCDFYWYPKWLESHNQQLPINFLCNLQTNQTESGVKKTSMLQRDYFRKNDCKNIYTRDWESDIAAWDSLFLPFWHMLKLVYFELKQTSFSSGHRED